MMTTGSAMLMVGAVNRTTRDTRSLEEPIDPEAPDLNALPGPGVYWDSNILVRQKGDLGTDDNSLDQNPSGNDDALYIDDELDHPLWNENQDDGSMGEIDYDDFPQENNNSSSKTAKQHSGDGLSKYGNMGTEHESFLDKNLENSLQEWPNQQERPVLASKSKQASQNPEYISTENTNFLHKELQLQDKWIYQDKTQSKNDKETTGDLNLKNNVHYQYPSNAEFDENYDYDYYGENDGYETSDNSKYAIRRGFSTSNPSADGFVRDRFESDDNDDGSFTSSVGEYLSRIVSSVTSPFMERLQTNFNIAQCSELVVCEAHRLGRTWGTPGLLLASGFR